MRIFRISTRGSMKFLCLDQSETSPETSVTVVSVLKFSTLSEYICNLLVTLVMTAELVKHFIPKLVELHNYTPANSTHQKLENWKTLNSKQSLCEIMVNILCAQEKYFTS